jgi:mono/diheme cytochrome c family protein
MLPCMKVSIVGAVLVALVRATFPAAAAPPKDSDDYPQKATQEAAILRGEIVFQNYCALCHGVTGDGRGRAARIYTPRPANLRESTKPDAYKELIVRQGGKALGRSSFMPPWNEELTDEQITDVVRYLRTIAPRGAPQ